MNVRMFYKFQHFSKFIRKGKKKKLSLRSEIEYIAI